MDTNVCVKMGEDIVTDFVKPITYDVIYWKKFFSEKKEGEDKSSVQIKSFNSIELKNVKINGNTFSGIIQLDNHKCPCFFKKFVLLNGGKKYVGNFNYRCVEGMGKIISNDYSYEGYVHKGKKWKRGKCIVACCGEGKDMVLPNGGNLTNMIYCGGWKNNQRDGYGILTLDLKDGRKKVMYKGCWKRNKRHFYGIQHYSNNSVYCGFWKANKKWGYGRMIWYVRTTHTGLPTGAEVESAEGKEKRRKVEHTYVGEWKNDERHGFGTYIWFERGKRREGGIYKNEFYDKYVGYWKKGKKNGYGIFYYNNGKKYIGTWKNDKKVGLGHLVKMYGIVSRCIYKNDELVSETEVNILFKMSSLYTNSLCNVINLFFLKKYFSVTNREIECFYKIIYANFDFLVNMYNRYKKKKKNLREGSFKLENLWDIFSRANILNCDFTTSSLNKLVIDHTSICEEDELFNLLRGGGVINAGELFPFNEKDMITKFFKFITLPLYISFKWYHDEARETSKGRNTEAKVILLPEKTESCINRIHDNNSGERCEKGGDFEGLANNDGVINPLEVKNKYVTCLDRMRQTPKDIITLMKRVLFNETLLRFKDCTQFHVHYWKGYCQCKQERETILERIYMLILKNKKRRNNSYLYYVLCSVWYSIIPLLFPLFCMTKRWRSLRQHGTLINNFVKKHNFSKEKKCKEVTKLAQVGERSTQSITCDMNLLPVKCLRDRNRIAYLKKLIMFINLHRYYLHDENRKVSFNCFVSTLVHVSLRRSNFCNASKQLVNIINLMKRCSIRRDVKLINVDGGNAFFGKRKRKMYRENRGRDKKENGKYKQVAHTMGKEEKKKKNAEDKNGVFPITNSYHSALLNKARKKEANCAYPFRGKKGSFLPIKNRNKMGAKELINILKNFVYYFIFYFLIFESREKNFSIFSIKLNISIQLKDILIFLYQLKFVKRSKVKRIATCFNLNSYSPLCKKKKKSGRKNRLHLRIMTCTGENEKNVQRKKTSTEGDKNGKTLCIKEEQMVNNNGKTSNNQRKKINPNGNSVMGRKNNSGKKWNDGNKQNTHELKNEHTSCINTARKKKKKMYFYLNSSSKGKKCYCRKKNVKGNSDMFRLSLLEILSIFAKILNTKNLHLINESCTHSHVETLMRRRKHKIHKHLLECSAMHYMRILLGEREKVMLTFSQCAKQNICHGKRFADRTNGVKKCSCPVHTKKHKNATLKALDEKLNDLDLIICEHHSDSANVGNNSPLFPLGKSKKRTEAGRKNAKCGNVKEMLAEKVKRDEVKSDEVHAHVHIKRKHGVKNRLTCLRRKYADSRKHYMNVVDYYSVFITPHEFLFFFLKFVKIIQRKRKIKSSYNKLLFFFIFHTLLRKMFELAKKKKKKGGQYTAVA
ncbi:conserved Plasmodium protein, unknown function [Plasmodium ovale curtisi]|uniref:MORN repeat protein n=1 Tax=Plasmodium ovale curtisi TaxID=864141 RepID=A0A1A8WIR5_PLAOA|nr:conserved Plasmodium protein, unknown function [Plasmodium ovale curtisi]